MSWILAAVTLTLVSLSVHVDAAEVRWLRDGKRFPDRGAALAAGQANGASSAQGEARRPKQSRLTAEERRQLRSDIQDARRKIYPRRRITRCNGGDC